MSTSPERRTDGYYDEEGEFYPYGSSAASQRTELYPKRPAIHYTTEPVMGTQLPEIAEPEPKQEAFRQCRHCGTHNKASSLFCSDCGKPLPFDDNGQQQDVHYCRHCGAQLNANDTFCPYCTPTPAVYAGIPNAAPNLQGFGVQGRPKKKITALLLCVFLGWAGAHRFYEGKIKSGVLWFLTGGFWGIGTIIDIIRLAQKPDIFY